MATCCPVAMPGLRQATRRGPLAEAVVAAAMVASLLAGVAAALFRLAADLPAALTAAARTALASLRGSPPPAADPPTSVLYYTGRVRHTRRKPAKHAFSYPVRTALVNLDSPPTWWGPSGAGADHLTADAARGAAGMGGGGHVWVLTTPPAAGYSQNPISVYYLWEEEAGRSGGGGGGGGGNGASSLPPPSPPAAALAVVTNTPWGARVTFRFDPRGDKVAKCLHVSPFMDMGATWLLSATPPGRLLHLAVGVDHPVLGRYFDAALDAECDGWSGGASGGDGGGGCCGATTTTTPAHPPPASRSERGSLPTLLSYGYMPHRIAAWIYWHAAVLLFVRGLSIFSPPVRGGAAARTRAAGGGAVAPAGGPADVRPAAEGGRGHAWTDAAAWPWSAQQ